MLALTNSRFSRTIPLLITILSLSFPAYAKYSGGTGEPNDPYQIATAEDLMLLGETPEDYDKHFILTADIDLDPNLPGRKVFDKAVIGSFTGVFDGNGNAISHLTIAGVGNLGLFGQLGFEAEIFNLGLEKVDVNGTGYDIGGLVGGNSGVITTSYSTGTVSGKTHVGGLVGNNNGTITTCYSTSTVSGDDYIGGLVGRHNWGASISISYTTGMVNGDDDVGGLVGWNQSNVTTSYSAGKINGNERVGGLVGWNFSGGRISTCYSTGTVSGNRDVGGFAGKNSDSIISSFWDTQSSGQSSSAGGMGLTTNQMQNINIYLDTGWDFISESLNGTCDYWQITQGDYPQLNIHVGINTVMPQGQGTIHDPYLIQNAQDLGTVWIKPTASYRLESSLDLSGISWSIPVIPIFSGIFDGNGQIIHNLHIEGYADLGLFGHLTSTARITNLGLEAVDVNGMGVFIAGLAGNNNGSISNSYSTGTVTGGRDVGGLVGANDKGKIGTCYSTVIVSGDDRVGGLVGWNRNEGRIITSYSTGTVSGDGSIGGLVGYTQYNGIADRSFWDVETSGISTSDGGIGLTTAEMMDPQIIGLVGLANDPNWILDSHQDYPRLAWEGTPGSMVSQPVIDWLEGNGTLEHPYEISTVEQLKRLSKAGILADKSFKLTNDLDLSGLVWSNAVIPIFNGIFDGNGYCIHTFRIQGTRHLGLFGHTEENAVIANLGLEAVDVNGTGDYIGALMGSNHGGSISNCYSMGTVHGNTYVGGLVGENWGGHITTSLNTGTVSGDGRIGGLAGVNIYGHITTSYSEGSVSGEGWHIGGLVGWNWSEGVITDSYSTSTVSGRQYVGGLAGENYYIITDSYSIGMVNGNTYVGGLVGRISTTLNSITSSFWDMETSGQDVSDGGIGKTTAEMQTASMFLEAGWDFVDETANGTEDIWWILEGQDYPRLWWELGDETSP